MSSDNLDKFAEMIENAVQLRLSAMLKQNIATDCGIHPEAIAVISNVMFESLLYYHFFWENRLPDEPRKSFPDVMQQFFGRPTLVVEKPEKAIQYFNSLQEAKDKYPELKRYSMFEEEEKDDKA